MTRVVIKEMRKGLLIVPRLVYQLSEIGYMLGKLLTKKTVPK